MKARRVRRQQRQPIDPLPQLKGLRILTPHDGGVAEGLSIPVRERHGLPHIDVVRFRQEGRGPVASISLIAKYKSLVLRVGV
jgi:hypothetical protein